MNAIFIFLLIAGVWGAFLLPPVFRSRRDTPISTTQEFTRLTARLAAVHGPAAQTALMHRRQVLARRRRMLIALAVTVAVSLLAAVALGSLPLLLVHVIADAALIWYVAMLLQIKQRQQTISNVVDITPVNSSQEQSETHILASS